MTLRLILAAIFALAALLAVMHVKRIADKKIGNRIHVEGRN